MPVYSSTGQLISPSDPNYAIYAAQNNPPPGGTPPPATPPNNPPQNPPSTPATAYGSLLNETPEERAYRLEQERLGEEARLRSQTNVDEGSIRRGVTDRFQAEIDALNRVYAEKKRKAMIEGEGRLGSDAAIQARRGLIGSTFGGAQTEKVTGFNNEIQSGIDDELNLMISGINSKIQADVAAELAAKNEAKRAGAEEYLSFLKGAAERKKQRISNAVKNIFANNITPDEAMFKGIAEQLGVSVETLKAQYNEIKAASDAAAEEKKLATDKTKSEIAKNYGDIENNMLKNVLENDKFSWQQKQDLVKNELEKSKLKADQTKADRDYQLQLQKYLLDVENSRREKGEIVKINGVDYEKQPDGTYTLPKTPVNADTSTSDEQIAIIDELLKPENASSLRSITGIKGPKNYLPGSTAQLVKNKLNQLIANLSLQNRQQLKGSGAISDFEFKVLQDASTAINTNLSNAALVSELTNLKTKLEEAKKQKLSAGGTTTPTQSIFDYVKQNPTKADAAKKILRENPQLSDDDVIQILQGFNNVGSDTNGATGARTDRHNNPAAFTVDIAKQAGLVLGKDYTEGDAFPDNPKLKTARLIGDPIAQTIKVIDRIGLYTKSGQPRWTYVNSIPGARNWNQLSNSQKVAFIQQMYNHEGGTALLDNFKIYA
ncbi:MAG: hypothetical protein JSS91_00770 [Bacteroidetes bacterium]|nr:hypothetical protein [Bacteroidota bacterium]